MADPVFLQKAQIIFSENDIIRIKHPDISKNLRTFLTASIAVSGVTATVKDNNGWIDNDNFILGYPGDSKTEACDINEVAPTRGTSLTITNSLKLSHEVDTPMIKIYELKIEIWGASTLAGSKTAVFENATSKAITWDKEFTEIPLTGAGEQYAFYFARFYFDGTTDGEYSDGVARTGLADNAVEKIIEDALDLTDETINDKITRDYLLRQFNNWQDDITNRRDWSFELVDEETITSTENENKYALSGLTSTIKHPESNKSIVKVRFADMPLSYMDWHIYLDTQKGKKRTTVASAITATDTSCTLTDTYEFNETGSILIGSDTVTYTANAESTGILTGVPASGTGAFASSHSEGDTVWQGTSAGKPTRYTIYNGNLYCERPISSTEAGKKFKISFYKKIDRVVDFADATDVPFYNIAQYFLAGRIEYKKGNHTEGDRWTGIYEGKIGQEVKKDDVPTIKKFVPQNDSVSMRGRGKFYKSSESSRFNYGG